jgi:hypothetical protein
MFHNCSFFYVPLSSIIISKYLTPPIKSLPFFIYRFSTIIFPSFISDDV